MLDKRVWRHTTQDYFTVKSAFEVIRSTKPKVWWAKYYKCLHPKARVFLWRVCHNVLVTEDNLRRRGFSFPSRCPLCLLESETANHLFWDCALVVPIWQWLLDSFMVHGYPHCMQESLGLGDNMSMYIKDLWRAAVINLSQLIWLSRNAVVFNEVKFNRNTIKVKLLAVIKETSVMTQNSMNNTVADLQIISKLGVATRARPAPSIKSCRWILPWYEEIKLNCCSSTMGNPGKARLGVIARTHTGAVLGVRTKGKGIINRFDAECSAIMEALSWAIEMGWKKVWIEASSSAAVMNFNSNEVPWKHRTKWVGMHYKFTALRISSTWKEGNFSADQATKIGSYLSSNEREDFVGTPLFITRIEDPLVEYFSILICNLFSFSGGWLGLPSCVSLLWL
ncbi:hypothetical protein GIB67_007661 [Kingdonia uniflora]|uniref:Reverse transcriptase zinc-binding domain-containing protein n=1 Tax=Kingdonia uniflora TaxID=39325 RepID=A0A7J7N1W8_9MAGN|nr:hypothetical protein GIB67_007661 [Kingdonia uniflora]